jgi:hypothetical protein
VTATKIDTSAQAIKIGKRKRISVDPPIGQNFFEFAGKIENN